MSRTKLIVLTVVGALAVPLFMASGAQADVGACTFQGATGNLENDDGSGRGVESVATDLDGALNPGNLPDFDDGSYEFDSNLLQCLYVDLAAGGESADLTGVFEADNDTGLYAGAIDASGDYSNQVCGTGTAPGTADLLGLTAVGVGGDGEGTFSASYDLQFVAGQGVLDITSASNDGDDGTSGNSDDESGSGLPVDGYVNITPTANSGTEPTPVVDPAGSLPPVSCVNADVTEFTATGAFALELE